MYALFRDVVVVAFVAFRLLTFSADADDQVVTDSADNGGGNQLRAKLTAAQSTGGGKITFDLGFATIVLTQGVLPTISTNCTIDGGGQVTISGNDAGRVFAVASGATLTLVNLTVTHGMNAGGDGGAIANSGTLNIMKCHFSNNHTASPYSGGAIINLGTLNIFGSEFANNSAGNGGAIYPRFGASMTHIANSSFHDNLATNSSNGWGGAMLLWDGAPVTISNSSFTSNGGGTGGAIYVFPNSSLNCTACTFSSNLVTASNGADGIPFCSGGSAGVPPGNGNPGRGGAIYNGGTTQLTNCTLNANTARGGAGGYGGSGVPCVGLGDDGFAFDGGTGGSGLGGAIYNAAVLTLTSCTVAGNISQGGTGGEAGFDYPDPSSHRGGNGGTGFGGGIYNIGTLTLGSSTIALSSTTGGAGGSGNNASLDGTVGSTAGGGLVQDNGAGSNNLRGNLIASNTANTGRDAAGAFTSQGYNLVGVTNGSSGFTAGSDRTGTAATPLNPGLSANGLQDNGGLTKTIALLAGSVAINHGDPNAPARDQRDYTRVNTPDIGAFERNGSIAHSFGNISTRGLVQTGNNILIGGLIITGGGPKQVIIRALGPTLGKAPFNVPGALGDPALALYDSSSNLVASNDNWQTASNTAAISSSGYAPPNAKEPAILISLQPDNYTAIVTGTNSTTGVALVEGYDLDASAASTFGNISTRGFVQTGANVLIGGVIVHGPDSQQVIIRGLGPTLGRAPFNVPNALPNPMLDLRNANGNPLAANDNWRSTQESAIQSSGFAPPDDLEAAILTTLAPGNYTAILSGVGGATGNGLVEAYAVN